MRRVVVTGIGVVSPLGGDIGSTWKNLIAGKSGIRKIDIFDPSDLAAKIGGIVPFGDGTNGTFNPDQWLDTKEQRKVDRFILFGLGAAAQAIADSGWEAKTQEDQERTGVMIGAGIGGLPNIANNAITLHTQGPRRISPFFIPSCLINLTSGYVSIKNGFKGPNHSVVTACSTGAHAIGDAARLIQLDDADVMIAGGSEAAICPLGVGGFAAMRALSTKYNDTPEQASRPWDADRDGFVMGEGAGIVVLEEYEHAKKRGAKIYAEVTGYGMSGDAYHITAPAEDGDGAYRAMRAALKRTDIKPEDIGYINAHGTSTPLGDKVEILAIKRLYGDKVHNVSVSSTKSSTGHLLGAAGGIEAIFAIKALNEGILPPTLNLHNPSEGCDLDLVPLKAKEKKLNHVMSNSFGFGGTNASLLFSKIA